MQKQQGRLSGFASFAIEGLNAFDGNPAIADHSENPFAALQLNAEAMVQVTSRFEVLAVSASVSVR